MDYNWFYMKFLWLTVLAVFTSHAIGQQDSLNVTKLGQLPYNVGLNDVWGYADGNGNEYALVGAESGFSIVDVTVSATPVEKAFIPGAFSIWRDIKTYSHYAYVIHDSYNPQLDTSDGILIVDLDSINESNQRFRNFFPTITLGASQITYDRSHNLYIDENGILYVFGSNIGVGGALMFDLKPDPENPVYIGMYNEHYLHDGMVRGDTLWGGAIYEGDLEVIDVSNKTAPVIMGSTGTPDAFTHSAWISDDNKTVFITDEVSGAYVAAYDVSDLSNIQERDRIQTSLGNGNIIPHNVHVYGDFVVTSYYTSGLQIVDATLPNVLLETAYYDTSPLGGDTFEGAWGAYPFLPSKNILVTDRQEGLFILHSDYPKGCYLTGKVKDSLTGAGIPNGRIKMLNTSKVLSADIFGDYATGVLTSGIYQIVAFKQGYRNDTVSLFLDNGVEVKHTFALLPFDFSVNEANEQGEIQLSPNPSQNYFTLHIDESVERSRSDLMITSVNGALVMQKELDLSNRDIRVEHHLKPGSYILNLKNKDMVFRSVNLLVVE